MKIVSPISCCQFENQLFLKISFTQFISTLIDSTATTILPDTETSSAIEETTLKLTEESATLWQGNENG